MSAAQLGLLGSSVGGIGATCDPLDRFYTPDPLALACVEALDAEGVHPRYVMEPSVGGGAFARAVRRVWPAARLSGCDVDPEAGGLACVDDARVADWPTWGATLGAGFDLVVGNPPFTGATAIPHVVTARLVSREWVALVLPWSPLGGVEGWAGLMTGRAAPAVVWPITPRPWPDSVRETALYLWRVGHSGRTQIAPPLVWR